MKKIIGSLVALVVTVGVVATAAYALFSDTVTVSGLTITTGNADLQISFNNSTWEEDHDFTTEGILADAVYPGYESPTVPFWLRNNSLSDIDLGVFSKLVDWTVNASGDWSALRGVVEVRVRNTTVGAGTGWQTLQAWNATGFTLPGVLSPDEVNAYEIQLRVSSAAGNEISERGLTNVTFDITGTQQ